ncbi:hypothetical protein NLU03_17280 [Bacillus toyonensis]|nr:hypothetical protein [Bacillus toyonensis]
MVWLLAYLIVVLLFTTIRLYPSICEIAYKNVDDTVILLSPFWYVLFGFDVAKFFYERTAL